MTAWLWETFGQDLAKKLTQDVWHTFKWAAAAQSYRKHLYEQYSTLHIFGMSEPVPLEGVFTHVVALDKPADRHRYDIAALQEEMTPDPARIHEVLRKRVYGKTGRVDGVKLVKQPDCDRLFILGKPGAGKTTFLKYLALQAAQGDLNQIPIFVTLREWRGEGDLMAFIARQFEICQFPEATPFLDLMLSHTDYGLVLFDGLDEIPQEGHRRAHAIDALRDFARQYPRAQVLITCRNAASDYTFQGFKYVELADFQEGQMHAFARKWFKAAGVQAVFDRFWEDFNKDEHRGIREMGRQPLLLTLLCLTYQETLHFPQRRVEIYEEALEALLKRWDSSRQIARDSVYKDLSLGRKRQLFARLAATFFDQGIYFIPQRELVPAIVAYVQGLPVADQMPGIDIDGRAILHAIEAQHGIVVQCAQRIYTFAHLTFQEYYTARYIVESVAAGDADAMARLLAHAHESRWWEVTLLVASMLSNADAFFKVFVNVLDTYIAGDAKLVELMTWAADKSNRVAPPYKAAALRSYYVALAFDRDRALDRDRILAFDRDRARARARHLALDLARDFDRDRARARDFDRALARASDRDRALAHDLAKDMGMRALHHGLSVLAMPDPDAPPEAWRDFRERLQALILERRNIGHDWELTTAQLDTLGNYLTATQLLVECLDVAYVTDRAAIEDRLVRPPQGEDTLV